MKIIRATTYAVEDKEQFYWSKKKSNIDIAILENITVS